MQYGHLKNFSLAFVLLLIKDNLVGTFSKAHIAETPCYRQFYSPSGIRVLTATLFQAFIKTIAIIVSPIVVGLKNFSACL